MCSAHMCLQALVEGDHKATPFLCHLSDPARQDHKKVLLRVPHGKFCESSVTTDRCIEVLVEVELDCFFAAKILVNATIGCSIPFIDASNQ